VGNQVKCFAGAGSITSINTTGAKTLYCVTLDSWVLAYGSLVKCHLTEEFISKVSPLSVGDYVQSYLGSGVVLEITSESRVKVELTNWELAYSSKVVAYLSEDQLTKLAYPVTTNLSVGQKVSCYAGSGTIVSIKDGTRVQVLLNNWELAYGSKVTCFLNETQLTVIEDFPKIVKYPVSTKVITPFGKGVVLQTRPNDYVVQLHKETWELAYGQKPTLYLSENMLTPEDSLMESTPIGGDYVKTMFGDGYCLSTRPDGVKIVESNDWKLAYGCSPRMFLEKGLVIKA
jgi:hypothetical protein